jgi:DNA-binding LacI/PurR family transcriptional regulator
MHPVTKPADAFSNVRPKYRIIQDLIRQEIQSGTLVENGKIPSEQDLARIYGVAYMTVRAALNDLVAEGLLIRIHGKGTFVAANTPVPSTSAGTVALVIPALQVLWDVAGLYYFPSILQGFCSEATRLGYEPTIFARPDDALTSAAGELKSLAGAACVLVGPQDEGSLNALRDTRIPVVGINRYRGRRNISYVAIDQAAGMADAVKYLADHGHRRIAFLPGPSDNLGAEERLRGFISAISAQRLKEAFVSTDEPSDYSDMSGALRTRMLLSSPKPPTAIITAGDLIAAGAMQAAREQGLSVPEDLSIFGFGDFEIASHVQPALTTVRLPLKELGAQAAILLSEQLKHSSRQQVVSLDTTLIERKSVASIRG